MVLGFLKGFPPNLVGDFSAGTGFAGIFSTFSLLGFKYLKLTDAQIFYIEMPTLIIMYALFNWLHLQLKTYGRVNRN